MSATLTVLGASATAPSSLGAAVGYLLHHEGGATLVDCGPGVVAELATRGHLGELSSIVISHEHADHCADLTALAYRRGFPERLPAVPMWAPTGFGKKLVGLDGVYGIPSLPALAAPLSDGFDLTEIEPGATVTVDGTTLTTIPAFHPVPTLAMRFDDLGLAYTADTGLTDELVEQCRNVPVLLAEATYRHSAGIDVSNHGHLTGRTVGELAAAANAGRLVITHLADPADGEEILAEARAVYDGPVELAAPGLVMQLG
ncbi:MBL fold metallo-hydrolase [Georgenia sp. Z1344]|uniref:MBL fold metallo-hydrolase n=1 Tax=Georgenia sp. Z1344 TaxID=3416706 RepID=UPI003CF78719